MRGFPQIGSEGMSVLQLSMTDARLSSQIPEGTKLRVYGYLPITIHSIVCISITFPVSFEYSVPFHLLKDWFSGTDTDST